MNPDFAESHALEDVVAKEIKETAAWAYSGVRWVKEWET